MKRLLVKTLFNLNLNNKPVEWSIRVDDDGGNGVITVSTGQVGGKITDRVTRVTKGKNIGKANETTPVQQALSQAESKITKQRDDGYCDEVPDEPGLNGLGLPKPMLALPLKPDHKEGGKKALNISNYVIQQKFDGFRMLAEVTDTGVRCYTRTHKWIDVNHIKEDLERWVSSDAFIARPVGLIFDGELYSHDLTFEQISSAAKKIGQNTGKLKYWIYDQYDRTNRETGYLARQNLVAETYLGYHKLCGNLDSLNIVGVFKPSDWSDYDSYHAIAVSQGYEGTIMRHIDQPYQPDGRDTRMLKRKDFHDEEFEITGIDRSPLPQPAKVGVDYPEGSLTDNGMVMQAQFICKTPEGDTFEASLIGGTLSRAKLYLANDEDYIGKLATVKYFEKSEAGIPRHPNARKREEL